MYRSAKNIIPEGPDTSVVYPLQEASHIPVGSPHLPYNSNPPSSGPHYAQPAPEGYYTDELPDEQIVHNLEHGNIWIAYHPRIAQEVKDALKQFDDNRMVITPRVKNENDIALVAWGRVDVFNIENGSLDVKRINSFITRYINTGPEKFVPSKHK